MKSSIVALLLIGLVAAASAEVFFREEFDGMFQAIYRVFSLITPVRMFL